MLFECENFTFLTEDQLEGRSGARVEDVSSQVERLRENWADFNEKLFKNLYQNRLDGQITGHVLV